MSTAEATGIYVGRYLVIGPPGTGKTTFLAKQAHQIVEKWNRSDDRESWESPLMICSLTRAAAAEIAGRDLPISKSSVGTLHSLCYRAINKPPILKSEHVEEWNKRHPAWTLDASDFGSSAKDEGHWESKSSWNVGGSVGDGRQFLERAELHRHRRVALEDWPKQTRAFFEAWQEFKRQFEVVDFTDMIELAFEQCDRAPENPWVIVVDEAQDFSRLEYELVVKWGNAASAIILVGDPFQALYVWRGADPSLFDDESVDASHRRTLSQSYRVPKTVLRASLGWVRKRLRSYTPIEYRPRKNDAGVDVDGSVESWHDVTLRAPLETMKRILPLVESGKSVIVQAACNYMLRPLLAELKDHGVPFSHPWRRERADWNPLGDRRGRTMRSRVLSFCSNFEELPEIRRFWTWEDLASWTEHVKQSGFLVRGAKTKIQAIAKDKMRQHQLCVPTRTTRETDEFFEEFFDAEVREIVRLVWAGDGMFACDMVEWWGKQLNDAHFKKSRFIRTLVGKSGIDPLFQQPRLHVGTIHSFKGAEADVSVVFPDLSSAGMKQWSAGDEARDEIVRMMYVAMTRAKETLAICGNDSLFHVPLALEVASVLRSDDQ